MSTTWIIYSCLNTKPKKHHESEPAVKASFTEDFTQVNEAKEDQ